MKLAVIGANGKAGKLIVKEAVNRGLDVTAVVRGDNTTVAQEVLKKDLFDLTAADLKGFDVVIDAFGAWTEETLPQHSTSLKHLCDILSGTSPWATAKCQNLVTDATSIPMGQGAQWTQYMQCPCQLILGMAAKAAAKSRSPSLAVS